MSTNREKYIDNASNEELARMLNEQATIYDYEEGLKFSKNSFCDEQIDYNPSHEEIDLETMQPVKTADEMFKELEYKKKFSDRNGCNYYHKEINRSGVKSEHIIHILANESSVLYGKYERLDDREFFANISEAEDKAIHKKIEELKNENRRNKNDNKLTK